MFHVPIIFKKEFHRDLVYKEERGSSREYFVEDTEHDGTWNIWSNHSGATGTTRGTSVTLGGHP